MASGSSNNKKLKKPDYIPSQRILSQKGYAILKENIIGNGKELFNTLPIAD